MDYYIVRFNDEKCEKYAVWYTDEKDGFICENGRIVWFDSVMDLFAFCKSRNIDVDENETPIAYDLGYLEKWLSAPDSCFNCSDMLDFWNVISDALNSIGVVFSGDYTENNPVNEVYDKLFYGCNLPAYNTSGKEYIPQWTEDEIELLRNVLVQYREFWC